MGGQLSDKWNDREAAAKSDAEKALDDLMKKVMQAIMEDESGLSIEDPKRMAEFETCHRVLRSVLRGKALKMTAVPHDDFPSVGTITVTGKSMSVTDTDLFARACALASNYEMYTQLDGTVVFNLTFYGMTRKVDE